MDEINKFLLSANDEELLAFFSFSDEGVEKVILKFDRWARMFYPRYFAKSTAPFHYDMVMGYANSYLSNVPFVNLGFRGCAKTSLAKLFIVFVLLNDLKVRKRYIKFLTKDLRNSKRLVTDVFNLIVEVKHLYGEVFVVDKEVKKEETMSVFPLRSGAMIAAGTVGQQHRGHLQDAFRPDWLIFDDIEDKESVRSIIITQGIIDRCDEALTGMSTEGSYVILGNYISKSGIVQWFLNKNVCRLITPVMDDAGVSAWPDVFTPEILAKMKENTNDWYGEYMQDPERSENSFFDLTRLNEAMLHVRPPYKVFQGAKYWASPEPYHRYGLGADIGDGSGKDSSTICVFDFTTGELVLTYANNQIQPSMFAKEIERIGYEFNTCIIAPESNNTGAAVIEALRGYPAMYQEITSGLRSIKRTDRMGWYSSKKSKPMMCEEFRRDFNRGDIIIYDIDFLKEMRSFSYGDVVSSETAMVTRHYDLVTAGFIALQMRRHASVVQEYEFEEEKPLYSHIGV